MSLKFISNTPNQNGGRKRELNLKQKRAAKAFEFKISKHLTAYWGFECLALFNYVLDWFPECEKHCLVFTIQFYKTYRRLHYYYICFSFMQLFFRFLVNKSVRY